MNTHSTERTRTWFRFVIERPVTISMVTAAVTILGILSYQRLPVNLMPELTYPTITVRAEYPGAAPEEVEDSIVRPIEEALGVVHGLVRISSIARAEAADVILEFQWDTSMDEAIQDVREKLDQVILPEGVRDVLVLRYDPSLDPIMSFALYGDVPLTFLRYEAEEVLAPELEGVEGVAAVRVKGGEEEEIHVELDEDALTQVGLSIQQVITRLQAENVNLAGGKITEGQTEYLVRTINEFKTLEDIASIIVGYREGAPIYLKDIARVRQAHEERTLITRVNGKEAVILEIYREGDANIVQVAENVRNAVFGSAAYHRAKKEYEKLLKELRKRGQRLKRRPAAPPQRAPGQRRGRRRPSGPVGRLMALSAIVRNKPMVERLPGGLSMVILSDQSRFIRSAIREVRDAALIGGLIAVLIIYLFLRKWWITLIIAVTIPLSVVATFLVMQLLGISLNMMSLGGLALGIGMLVDNAVVVLESIHRCQEEGDALIPAVLRGTGEVGTAVMASTLTTICVFFPMIFVEGVAGELFGDQAATIIISLLASLTLALFFVPMLRSRQLQPGEGGEKIDVRHWLWPGSPRAFLAEGLPERPARALYLLKPLAWVVWFITTLVLLIGRVLTLMLGVVALVIWYMLRIVQKGLSLVLNPSAKFVDRTYHRLLDLYDPLLRSALRHPFRVFVILFVIVCSSFVVVRGIGTELIPEVHQGEFIIRLEFPVGTSLEWNDRVLTDLAARIAAMNEVKRVVTYAGTDPVSANLYEVEGDHTGKIQVVLKPVRDIARQEDVVLKRIRELIAGLSQVRMTVRRPTLFSIRNPIEIEIRGDNLAELRRLGEGVTQRIRRLPNIRDVALNMGQGFPEVQIRYDRARLSQYGLDLIQVAEMVRDKVLGNPATQLRRGEQLIDIRVLVRPEDRARIQDLVNLNVNPKGQPPIPLKAVADIDIVQGPSEIRRIQQRRVALITAGLEGFDLGGTANRIRQILQDIELPEGYEIVVSGQSREMQTSLKSMRLALALAVFLVYVVMASQFESFLNPLIIMFAIPLASVGVIFALWLGGFSLNVVVLIGVIILAGIVVNNAIVLLDYVEQLRRRGTETMEAIVQAGRVRLRPILITTLTTVLALIPMALGLGEGAELRQPMAWTIIAGLSSSTLLTLILIPVIYGVLARFRRSRGMEASGEAD